MTEQEIFKAKVKEGYTICFAEQCPMKERCLRYLVGQQMPDTKSTCHCVNPHYQVTTQFTTLAPASETGNNIFHPCATDSPENSYLCTGK